MIEQATMSKRERVERALRNSRRACDLSGLRWDIIDVMEVLEEEGLL